MTENSMGKGMEVWRGGASPHFIYGMQFRVVGLQECTWEGRPALPRGFGLWPIENHGSQVTLLFC